MATIIDTHESVKNPKKAGFEEIQAEALVAELKKTQESMLKDLATKEDIKDLKTEVSTVKAELKADIRELRAEFKVEMTLMKWMIGVIVAGVISLVLKAFFM